MAFQNELDEWIQLAKTCQYLPENDLKVRPLIMILKATSQVNKAYIN